MSRDLDAPGEQADQRQQREAAEQKERVAVPDPVDRNTGDHRPEKAGRRKPKRKQAEIHGSVLRPAHLARDVVDRDMTEHEPRADETAHHEQHFEARHKESECNAADH